MNATIHLFGASVRGLAGSVRRGGGAPVAYDLFADWDLRRSFTARRLDPSEYPLGFARFSKDLEGRPWIYTGGLENHPELLETLAREGPLWGNSAAVVRIARDPARWRELALAAGADPPRTAMTPTKLPLDGSWLRKPLRGAGGRGIAAWTGDGSTADCYFQERLAGTPHAAAFVAAPGRAILLGVTRQWIGSPACHAPAFGYCGSIGPVAVPEEVERRLSGLGAALARELDLRGWFGVDFLLDQGRIRPVELNPRYTASIEVLEFAAGGSSFSLHRSAFQAEGNPGPSAPAVAPVVGKAVLYAGFGGRVKPDAELYHRIDGDAEGWFADLPDPGSAFRPGEPLLTILAGGPDAGSVEERLLRRLEEVERRWLVPE